MSGVYQVYNGVWTDYSSSLRYTLTLPAKPAGLLSAALVTFISSFVASGSWSIVRFMLHQLRARKIQRDCYDHQQQVLLRNSGSHQSAFTSSLLLFWAWKKPHNLSSSLGKALMILLPSLVLIVAWAVAGIFTSLIWTAPGDAVKIYGPNCGYWLPASGSTKEENTRFERMVLSETLVAEVYVQQCYGPTLNNPNCVFLPTQKLNWTTSNVSCPFSSAEVCHSGTQPYQMSTSKIDSHYDLGINSPKENRVYYQKAVTCSPIHAIPFAEAVNAKNTSESQFWPPGDILDRFYFGKLAGSSDEFTFEYSTFTDYDAIGYNLVAVTSNPATSYNIWNPVSNLSRTDAEVSLFFLMSNHIYYQDKVDDVLFNASTPYAGLSDNNPYYVGSQNVNVLGCIDQHRVCNPGRSEADGCTAYAAYGDVVGSLNKIGLNPAQIATAQRILSNGLMTSTFNAVNGRGAAALKASQSVFDLVQVDSLPNNQWNVEVEKWFQVSLAKLQQGTINFVVGPSDPALVQYVTTPDKEAEKLCREQKIRRSTGTAKQNFNLGAIIIVVVLGLTIVVVGFFIDTWVGKWQNKRGKYKRLQLEWVMDGPYQLQRLAYEQGAGVPEWEKRDESIPTVPGNVPLPVINEETLLLESYGAHAEGQTATIQNAAEQQYSTHTEKSGAVASRYPSTPS